MSDVASREIIDKTAKATASMSRRALDFLKDLDQVLKENSTFAIDWGNVETPPLKLEVDADGNIQGLHFSRFRIANAIGTLATLKASVDESHLGNLRYLAGPKAT
jgi:hypothetical protein